MKKLLIIAVYFYSVSVLSLTCSSSKLHVYFINGVWNNEDEAKKSSNVLEKILSKSQNEILPAGQYELVVTNIYNQSHGTIADLIELDLEIQSNGQLTNGKELEAFFTRKIIDNGVKKKKSTSQRFPQKEADAKVVEAYERELKKIFSKDSSLTFKLEDVQELKIENAVKEFDYNLAEKVRLLGANMVTVKKTIAPIRESLRGKNKVIAIAHSQGNEVLKQAQSMMFHGADDEYLTRAEKIEFAKVLGVVNIGSPSPQTTLGCYRTTSPIMKDYNEQNLNCKNEAIKVKSDAVIGGTFIFPYFSISENSIAPNYSIDFTNSYIGGSKIREILTDYWFPFRTLFFFGFSSLSHGVQEIYLSDTVKARHINEPFENPIKPMSQIFSENVISVAESLESNCSLPEAVINYDTDPRSLYVGENAVVVFNAKKSLPYRDEPQRLERFKSINWEINGFTSEVHFDGVVRWGTRSPEIIKGEGEEFTFHFRVAEEYTVKLTVEREDGAIDVSEFKFSTRNRDAKVGEITTTCILKPDFNYADELHSGFIADHDSGEYGYYYSEDSSGNDPKLLSGGTNYVREDLKALFSFSYTVTFGDGKKQPVEKKTIWVFKRHKFINDSPLIPMGTMSYDLFSCDRE